MDNSDTALFRILIIVAASFVILFTATFGGCENGDDAKMISRTERVILKSSFFGLGPKSYHLQMLACEPLDGCNWETYFESPNYEDIETTLNIGKEKK